MMIYEMMIISRRDPTKVMVSDFIKKETVILNPKTNIHEGI
jgi:hypothetical protein